jgi:conjugal transfer pilin signal peptidase TrbI
MDKAQEVTEHLLARGLKARQRQRGRLIILRWACAIAALGLIYWAISPFASFALNATDSIDGTLFYVVKGQFPQHGEIAAFHPPKGNLYPDEMWFGKYIVGYPGDVVTIVNRSFYINGRFIGTAKEYSTTGKKMEMSSAGVISAKHYFMWTAHENSYDSRYNDINWIPESSIFGRVTRIF